MYCKDIIFDYLRKAAYRKDNRQKAGGTMPPASIYLW